MLKTSFPNRPEVVRTATEIDLKLIQILREDGRAIGRVFAQQTELSEATISRRLVTLEESALLRVRGYVDLQDSGCNAAAMIRFSTTGSPDSFASALALRSCFYRIATVVGQSEVIALVACATPSKLLAEIELVLDAHHDATIEHSSEILHVIPPLEARAKKISPKKRAIDKSNTTRRCRVHSQTIRALQQDFRMTVVQLASSAEISSPAASAKLQEVIDHQDIRPIVVVDPHFIARLICAQLRISVRRNIYKIAQTIVDTLNPDWVFICLQTEQILLDISVADESDLLRWQHEIKKIAGVSTVACTPFSAVYKQSFDWNTDEPKSHTS
ncbi:MAG: Lrp/AsnC family transcriptional regulator [Planctomycetota bacterium]|nr:Lrp/AsnC family transcriptional regulator [Planctomycetota bacterium]MDA1262914.1 Lrp/AsnC family transcriptional regulator [Planctomycetota bacterium]